MSADLFADPAVRQVAADLPAASTVYTLALESAVTTFRGAGLEDQAKTIERVRELHRLHHAQIDALVARLTSNAEVL